MAQLKRELKATWQDIICCCPRHLFHLLTSLPQIITTVDCRSISHIYVIYRNFTPHYQFLSQKFGNFKGGGKFAVTLIELIYAHCNCQIYNIIGLYIPYINRAIFNKIRYNSLWHILCILMIICDLHKSIKKSLNLITILDKFT